MIHCDFHHIRLKLLLCNSIPNLTIRRKPVTNLSGYKNFFIHFFAFDQILFYHHTLVYFTIQYYFSLLYQCGRQTIMEQMMWKFGAKVSLTHIILQWIPVTLDKSRTKISDKINNACIGPYIREIMLDNPLIGVWGVNPLNWG